MIFSSHEALGGPGRTSEVQLEGFTTAYYAFEDGGAGLTLASPRGGEPPLGRARRSAADSLAGVARFKNDPVARTLFADTIRLDQVYADDFDAIYVAGGCGAWWDLAADDCAAALASAFWCAEKPMAFVGSGPVVLLQAMDSAARPIMAGKAVTGLSDAEVRASSLAGAPPFSLEAALRAGGGLYRRGPDGDPLVVQDGRLITGQNPASAAATAQALLATLGP
jgi:putative intracellular protease/amidase